MAQQPAIAQYNIDYTLFNCEKGLMRTTTDRIPNTVVGTKEMQFPLGVAVKPFGDLSTVSLFLFLSILKVHFFLV